MAHETNRPVMLRAGGKNRGTPELTAASGILFADVSEFQPDIADAAYLSWSRAVGIRALFGASHDDKAWFGGARRDQLHAGGARVVLIYQYLVAGQDGAAQARAFHGLVGPIRPGEIFVADYEQGSHAMLTAWYDEMLSLYGPQIHPWLWTYTGLDFGLANGAMPAQWLADYTSREPSQGQVLWQFSESYPVPGVGRCDCNLFRGTIDQLAALAYQAPAPVPPKPGALPPVRGLNFADVTPNSVRLQWASPAGPSKYATGWYQVTIRRNGADLPTYPRWAEHGKSPQTAVFDCLPAGSRLTAMVRAEDPNREHASEWQSVTFETAA